MGRILGDKRKNRAIEVLTSELDEVIYVNMKARIEGHYYGEKAAKFDDLVRRGVIVGERK